MSQDFGTITQRLDGSYIITRDGHPFHVPNEGGYSALWEEVDAFALANPEKVTDEPPPAEPTPEELAESEKQAAETESAQILTSLMQRNLAQTASFAAAEFAVFAKAGLYPEWTPGTLYAQGNRFVFGAIVYETQQAVTAQGHQTPGSTGMLAVYRPISVDAETGAEPDGSLGHPYSFITGMDVHAGKHYSYEGRVYLAKADMLPCTWAPGTAGLWQWELVG